MYTDPTVADFKTRFERDFQYGNTPDLVKDGDITNALQDAKMQINPKLFGDQANYTYAFLYLAAHHLTIGMRRSTQGLTGAWNWGVQSKGVGSVSESFIVPQEIANNPLFAGIARTNYGAQYIQFILPRLRAPIFVSRGDTSGD